MFSTRAGPDRNVNVLFARSTFISISLFTEEHPEVIDLAAGAVVAVATEAGALKECGDSRRPAQ